MAKMMLKIKAISALKDNYIWVLINDAAQAIVVDPGDAAPVLDFLAQEHLDLVAVLATHRHADHTQGIEALLEKFPKLLVFGASKDQVPFANYDVHEGQDIVISGFLPIQVLEIPGHTQGHVAYLIENNLFCGDTLFAAGCGRVFDGTYMELFDSLQKLAALPDATYVYSGHEYTLANLKFAAVAEPENKAIQQRIQECEALRAQNLPSLPSNIALEKQTNPFLRVSDFVAFKTLREWKNNF